MKRKIKAALIDMDGTLYDSMPNHARAWKLMFDELGFDLPEKEIFILEGSTGAFVIDLMMKRWTGRPATEKEKIDLYARKSRLFSEQPRAELMPGAVELIRKLTERGIATVLVTGSGQGSMFDRLEEDFPGAFPPNRRVTSASVLRGKPFPEPFLKGLELAGVAPREAIAIDNAPLGVRSASDAGVFTIGVVTGPIHSKDLADAGADIVFPSMEVCADSVVGILEKLES